MNRWRLYWSAVHNLRNHRLRVFLTMIGIIVGISSVVAVLSIGEGLKAQVKGSFSRTDGQSFLVSYDGIDLAGSGVFDPRDLQALQELNGVRDAARSDQRMQAVNGTTEEAKVLDRSVELDVRPADGQDSAPLYGRSITIEDNELQREVIVVPESSVQTWFGDRIETDEAIGKAVLIRDRYFQIVGINEGPEEDNVSYVSQWSADLLASLSPIYSIEIEVDKDYEGQAVFKEVSRVLHELHPEVTGQFSQMNPAELSQAFVKIIAAVTYFIAVVSSVSLFVAGVGVMNIMYVSVSERSREIGIRRAIGARPGTIRLQFLIESSVITLIGGIAGILLGQLAALAISLLTPFPPVLTLQTIIVSSGTSVLIGIVFGIAPASRAAKLTPIQAINS